MTYWDPGFQIGPLHDPVTWYKITLNGEQVTQWNFQNNALAFVLEVPPCKLLTNMCDFAPCDRVVQIRAYSDVSCLQTLTSYFF